MNEVLATIQSRRTLRKYQPVQIGREALDLILEAGLWAPSAGCRQSPLFLVCQDPDVNETLGRINRAAFGKATSDATHYVSKVQASIADDDAIASGFYGAPTVVALFAQETARYSVADCAVAAENLMLAAASLGIGSCYVGRCEETFDSEVDRSLMRRAGIPDGFVARTVVCLGYPEGEPGAGKPRKPDRIVFVTE